MYQSSEVDVSRRYLPQLFTDEAEPCLLGGWAVYLSVNEKYRAANGRDYIGSRDIDVGFHVDTRWSKQQLEESPFGIFLRKMQNLGFESQSFRLYKDFDESLRPLSRSEADARPAFELVKLYIDPVVDHIHPLTQETFGFTPIDEPLLEPAFNKRLFRTHSIGEVQTRVLAPNMLLATKLNSVVIRDQRHKRAKDIADIYSLIWYSGPSLTEIHDALLGVCSDAKTKAVITGITDEEIIEVSRMLGIESIEIRRVLKAFSET